MEPQTWATKEFKTINLGDHRLNKRLINIVTSLSTNPGKRIPQAMKTWKNTKGCYRFFDNERVVPEKILQAHKQSTIDRIKEYISNKEDSLVLVASDMTTVSYANHTSKTELGRINTNQEERGLFIQSALALSTTGIPLGLLSQNIWARDAKQTPKIADIKEKESFKWFRAMQDSVLSLPQHLKCLYIADREADIHDLFLFAKECGSEILIRGTQNRCIKDSESTRLYEHLEKLPVMGNYQSEIDIRVGQGFKREKVNFQVKFAQVTLSQTSHHKKKSPITIGCIQVKQTNAKDKPIEWLLLTSLALEELSQAIEYVEYYKHRWKIERFHFVLKSGYNIEKLLIESLDNLKNALTVISIVAWRVLWITYWNREIPNTSCEKILEVKEWKALYCAIHENKNPPDTPPTIHDAIIWIARLGGFLARKNDGEPGVITIWRGLQELKRIVQIWSIFNPNP